MLLNTNLVPVTQQTTQKQSPSFTAVNLVQVSKKAFAHPENLTECYDLFGKSIDILTKDKLTGFWGNLIALFTPKNAKTAITAENYSYSLSKRGMEEWNLPYCLNWVRQNTGLPIKEPLDNEYHSFYVYTKEHKVDVAQIFKDLFKKMFSYSREAVKKYPRDLQMVKIYSMAKCGVDADAAIEKLTADTPVNKFKINSLAELKDIIKDFDV